jgi:hypothetical protein
MNALTNVDIHSGSFQSFMMAGTIEELNAEAGCTLQEAKQRVLALCSIRDDRFKDLACALTKYDFCGAASNWNPEYNHEETIIKWAEGVIEEEDSEAIDNVIDSYKQGYIPDCFDFMINHLC